MLVGIIYLTVADSEKDEIDSQRGICVHKRSLKSSWERLCRLIAIDQFIRGLETALNDVLVSVA